MSVNSKMTAIANAIRTKRGISGTLTLDQMATEIGNIQTGITPRDTKTIIANGTYDVTEFASAMVNVSDHLKEWDITLTNDTAVDETLILSGDEWIAENWNDPNLWLFFTTQDFSSIAERSLFCFNGNQKYIYNSIFGMLLRKNGANIESVSCYGPPDRRVGTQMSNRIYAYPSGNVTVKTTSTGTYPYLAGSYKLFAFIAE